MLILIVSLVTNPDPCISTLHFLLNAAAWWPVKCAVTPSSGHPFSVLSCSPVASRQAANSSDHKIPTWETMPRAWPRGTMVALWMGCAPAVWMATSAWPLSWYAVRLRDSAVLTIDLHACAHPQLCT